MENKVIRAAIYTRKSSEEGLELSRVRRTSCETRHTQRPVSDFNSLDGQKYYPSQLYKKNVAPTDEERYTVVEKS